MPDTAESYRLLREECAIVRPEPVALFEFVGEDVLEWLQGQATNDLRKLLPEFSLDFCLCKATGQIEAVCTAWRVGDAVFVATPEACAPVVERRVETMVILEDVRATRRRELHLLSAQGPKCDELVAGGGEAPALDGQWVEREGVSVLALRSNRLGFGGWDLWTSSQEDQLNVSDPVAYEAARIEAGRPLWGADIGPKTLPAEMGAAFESQHVSYQKGCYVGQEVLMRMHARGRANWDWMGVVAESPLAVGAKVSSSSREDAGTVTSAAVSPRLGPIGAARVRREIAMDGQAIAVGGVPAVLRAFPLT